MEGYGNRFRQFSGSATMRLAAISGHCNSKHSVIRFTIIEFWLGIWNRVLKPVFENSKCRVSIRIMRTGKDQKTKVHNGIQNGFKFQFISPNSRGEITI